MPAAVDAAAQELVGAEERAAAALAVLLPGFAVGVVAAGALQQRTARFRGLLYSTLDQFADFLVALWIHWRVSVGDRWRSQAGGGRLELPRATG